MTFHTASVSVPGMGQDKCTATGEPDRKPDFEEALTESQLLQAVYRWLTKEGRLPDGNYTVSVRVHLDGATVKAWHSEPLS